MLLHRVVKKSTKNRTHQASFYLVRMKVTFKLHSSFCYVVTVICDCVSLRLRFDDLRCCESNGSGLRQKLQLAEWWSCLAHCQRVSVPFFSQSRQLNQSLPVTSALADNYPQPCSRPAVIGFSWNDWRKCTRAVLSEWLDHIVIDIPRARSQFSWTQFGF